MALFFRNNMNNRNANNNMSSLSKVNTNNTSNNRNDNIQNVQNPQQPDIQAIIQKDGINYKQLTEEDMKKINEEIRENIEKNRSKVLPTEVPEEKDIFLDYLKEFIQYEKNANKFYLGLSKKCDNKEHSTRLLNIGNECDIEMNNLTSLFKSIEANLFTVEEVEINTDITLNKGLLLAIEEEVNIYDKLCKAIDTMPVQDTRNFNSMALKKLGRINNIQNILLNLKN